MNGKEVFHDLYQRYSNIGYIDIEIKSREHFDENNFEINKNIEENNKAQENNPINKNETELTFEEMTEKLKNLYQLNEKEMKEEEKEKELILFDEIANSSSELQLNSVDEYNSLEKLNNIKCTDENFIVRIEII
jgi:hypothetical protein